MAAALLSRLIRAARDRRASVALELAFVFPLILLIAVGFYETYMYVRTVAQLERAVSSVANMMGRQTVSLVDCGDADAAMNLGTYVAAAEIMADPIWLKDNGQIILSAVDFPANRSAPRVAWQRRSTYQIDGATSVLGRQGWNASLPNGMTVVQGDGDTVLVAEIFYHFKPFAMTTPILSLKLPVAWVTLHRTAFFRARMVGQGTLGTTVCKTLLPTP